FQHLSQSLSQYPQLFLSDDISTLDLQVSFVYSVQQDSLMSNVLTMDTTDDNTFDISLSEKNESEDQLNIIPGSVFISWEQLDHHIRMYAKHNGFVAIIVGSESDDITLRRCRYACGHQGISHLKKTVILEQQNESYTKQIGCKWLVNASCPNTTGVIKITSCHLEHNHEIHLNNIIFALHYRQYPDEVKQDIEYYTSK
ncbi:5795_t:CDS:1, partial [Cetraspora pellucida]